MLRIISGRYKGHTLDDISSNKIRPTQARVKKSMLQILEPFRDKIVLDLFSGSGCLGIEAISRGASRVVSIENNKQNFKLLNRNFNKISPDKDYQTIFMDAIKFLNTSKLSFDIIICDPPYFKFDYMEIFNKSIPLMNKGGIFCMEMEKNMVDEDIFRVKLYGDTQIILWTKK